jgi:hypothetical protein
LPVWSEKSLNFEKLVKFDGKVIFGVCHDGGVLEQWGEEEPFEDEPDGFLLDIKYLSDQRALEYVPLCGFSKDRFRLVNLFLR